MIIEKESDHFLRISKYVLLFLLGKTQNIAYYKNVKSISLLIYEQYSYTNNYYGPRENINWHERRHCSGLPATTSLNHYFFKLQDQGPNFELTLL